MSSPWSTFLQPCSDQASLNGFVRSTLQDPLTDSFDPSSAPELPGQVEPFAIAYGYWFMFLAAAALLSWWAWQWLLHAQAQRQQQSQHREDVAAEASTSLVQRAYAKLQGYLQHMSAEQRREAECLSHLLREQVGRSAGWDCHSATDAEILEIALVELEKSTLQPLLKFVSSVLFTGHRPTVAQWESTLRDVEAWLKTQGEEL